MKKPLITLMLLATGAISLQATAQTKAEFDELRQEVMRLRQEINAQKAATSAAPAATSAGVIDRLDQVEIKQKDAVVLGDIGGSFRLPGSETSVKLYGFAELNMVREGKADNSGNDYSTFVPYAPINGTNARKGQT